MLFNSARTDIPESYYQAIKDSQNSGQIRVCDCMEPYHPGHVGAVTEETAEAEERAHWRAELARLNVPEEYWPNWIAEATSDEESEGATSDEESEGATSDEESEG